MSLDPSSPDPSSPDPYRVLGVPQSADACAIKAAFRALAKAHHPDRNPDDPSAPARFQEIHRAFELLSDPQRRALHDAARGGARGGSRAGGFDLDDLLDRLSRGVSRDARGTEIRIDLRTAALGGTRAVTIADRALEVQIPPGARDGEILSLDVEGRILMLRVEPHPVFRREGEDLYVDVQVTEDEALHGAVVLVPTLDGAVKLKVPAGTQPGCTLRLRGRGLQRPGEPLGDLYVRMISGGAAPRCAAAQTPTASERLPAAPSPPGADAP